MRKLLWLLLALPLGAFAQPSNPSVRYVSVAPSGACSASPPVQVVISTGAIYTCNNGTWGAASSGTAPFGPFVTSAPYNAYCDGNPAHAAHDTVAIQAAIDANSSIQFPISTTANQQQCNVTNLVQHNRQLTIFGNGSILACGNTSGSMISTDDTSGWASLTTQDLWTQVLYTSGTPTVFNLLHYYHASFINGIDSSDPAHYNDYKIIDDSAAELGLYLNGSSLYGVTSIVSLPGSSFVTAINSQLGKTTSNADYFTDTSGYVYGDMDLTGSVQVTLNSMGFGANLNLTGVGTISGNIAYNSATTTITGTPGVGQLCYSNGSIAACKLYGSAYAVSGCSLTSAVNGAGSGSFHSGTTGTCTVTITPGFTAAHGFSCWTNDMTTPADHIPQTAYNATTATISGVTVSGDVITYGCMAF